MELFHFFLLKLIGAHLIFEPVAPSTHYPTSSIGQDTHESWLKCFKINAAYHKNLCNCYNSSWKNLAVLDIQKQQCYRWSMVHKT